MEIDPALQQHPRIADVPIDPRLEQLGLSTQGIQIHPGLVNVGRESVIPNIHPRLGNDGNSADDESDDDPDTDSEHSSERVRSEERELNDTVIESGPEGGLEEGGLGLGEEYDPSIREIVKSLAHAQQNSTPQSTVPAPIEHPEPITDDVTDEALSQALRYAQTVGAMSEQLGESGDTQMTDQMGLGIQGVGELPKNLAEFSTDFESLFQPSHDPNFLLPDYAEPGPSTHPFARHPDDLNLFPAIPPIPATDHDLDQTHSPTDIPTKRGRGRPKGSKNRPKSLDAPPRPVSEPKPRQPKEKPLGPVRKVGRPPKVRTGAELEEFLRRKQEAEMGFQRKRGRPRKFPGYLVREMRLKKNREEFREVVRRHTGGESEILDLQMGVEDYDWANDPQNLMDAVSGLGGQEVSEQMFMEGHEGEDGEGEEPSANTGLGGDGVGEVFGLHQGEAEEG